MAHTRSFTRAAGQLGRVQSAVSVQIRRLEDIVGARLFNRTRRSITLTADGEQLLIHARRLIAMNEQALADLGRPGVAGKVRFGVTDTSALYLRPVLQRFAEVFPLTQFEIRCTRSWEALDALEAGEIDLALVTQPCDRDGGAVVRREAMHWVVARTSLAAEQDPLPLAMFANGCIYRRAILAALDDCGRSWRLAYNSPSRDLLQVAVESGLAVTALPESLIGTTLRRLGSAQGLPPLPDMQILLFRNPASGTRSLDTLADVITRVLAEPIANAA